ncbi:MAG: trypsin-like peptidase domain-containing protein [Longimicrobiales bacterium]
MLALLVAGGATGWNALSRDEADAPSDVASAATPVFRDQQRAVPDAAAAGELSAAFRTAARSALPGVVYIEIRAVGRNGQPAEGSGSGFVFRTDGYIITNNHVVDGATRVTVVLQDRREFVATLVGRDPNTDIAVLKIDVTDLPVTVLGDSDVIEVGDWVVALGYPLDMGSSATAGIVSALGRNIGILQRSREASAPLEHFIQTDAAINPGNSGGPLVDLGGRVVGVSSAIASPTGYYNGYSFAVPINIARRVAEDLIAYGEVHRPQLGVVLADVDPADADVYDLPAVAGAEIVQVTPGSPAEKAGLELGDVVTAVDGAPVNESGDLMELLARNEPGHVVHLRLVRFGEAMDTQVRLGEFEPAVRTAGLTRPEPEPGLGRLGFAATDLTPAIARGLGVERTQGVVISQVDNSGGAARAGLRAGNVIESFDGEPIDDLADLRRATDGLRAGEAVSLVVRGADGIRTIINYRVRG